MKKVVLNILMNGAKFSWSIEDIVQKIYDSLLKKGFIALTTNAVETDRTNEEVLEALDKAVGTIHRIRTAVRTNLFEAINEARYSHFTDPALDGFVEAIEYSAILDDRTTDLCKHLDMRVYESDDPIWDEYRPPNHFNCRSLLIPVTIIDTEVVGKDNLEGTRYSKQPILEPQEGFGG